MRIYFWIIRVGEKYRDEELPSRKGQIVLLRGIGERGREREREGLGREEREGAGREAISSREIYDARIDSFPMLARGIAKFGCIADIRCFYLPRGGIVSPAREVFREEKSERERETSLPATEKSFC